MKRQPLFLCGGRMSNEESVMSSPGRFVYGRFRLRVGVSNELLASTEGSFDTTRFGKSMNTVMTFPPVLIAHYSFPI